MENCFFTYLFEFSFENIASPTRKKPLLRWQCLAGCLQIVCKLDKGCGEPLKKYMFSIHECHCASLNCWATPQIPES